MRLNFALFPALGAAILTSGCVMIDLGDGDRYQAPFHYSYDLAPGGRVNLATSNGEINISGWDEKQIDISGVKYASSHALLDSVKVDIHAGPDSQRPDSIDIRTVRPSEPFSNTGVRYTIHVPRSAVLDRIVTTNGPVEIHDVSSGVHVKTSNGTVRATNLGGDVDAQTSNGRIELTSIHGSVSLRTTNGRIRAERIDGACEAHASNGTITLRFESAPAGPVRISTSNGAVDLAFAEGPKDSIHVETSNGSIALRLPEHAGARLEANTHNSSIDTELNVNGSVRADRDSLTGTLGAGGPLVQLSTHNGRIRLLRN